MNSMTNMPEVPSTGQVPHEGSQTAVEVHDLTVAYQHKPVLWDVDVDLPSSRLIAIIGPNGAGKTTLMKAILGLIPVAGGEVKVFGKPVAKARSMIGYVPQRESVDWDFPVNVFDVVLMGRYGRVGWIRRPGKMDQEIAMNALERVGMADYADRQISQLSGGQQQRVFLARALAQDALIYFMDEPFVGVDAATEKAIVDVLRSLRADNKTVITVHHDLQTVSDYYDYVVLLNTRIIAAGPTQMAFTQENLQKTYSGRLTLLEEVGHAMKQAATGGLQSSESTQKTPQATEPGNDSLPDDTPSETPPSSQQDDQTEKQE